MKTVLTTRLTATFLAAALCASGTAYAQDDDLFPEDTGSSDPAPPMVETSVGGPATFGIGFSETLAGLRGPEIEYFIGDKLMITGLLAIFMSSPDAEGADTATVFALAGGGFYELAAGDDTAFMIGGRLDIGVANEAFTGGMDGATQFNIEIPARVQVWLSSFLSFHLETGLVLAFIPEEGAVIPPGGPADGSRIILGSELFGAGGITVYWP
jgi:hypothetical protein